MKVHLTHKHTPFWTGDLNTLARDNEWDESETEKIRAELLEFGESLVGGGAGPLFVVVWDGF